MIAGQTCSVNGTVAVEVPLGMVPDGSVGVAVVGSAAERAGCVHSDAMGGGVGGGPGGGGPFPPSPTSPDPTAAMAGRPAVGGSTAVTADACDRWLAPPPVGEGGGRRSTPSSPSLLIAPEQPSLLVAVNVVPNTGNSATTLSLPRRPHRCLPQDSFTPAVAGTAAAMGSCRRGHTGSNLPLLPRAQGMRSRLGPEQRKNARRPAGGLMGRRAAPPTGTVDLVTRGEGGRSPGVTTPPRHARLEARRGERRSAQGGEGGGEGVAAGS